MFRGAPFCFTARTTDNPHHVVAHGESVAEIKMKGDTTPMRVLLVVRLVNWISWSHSLMSIKKVAVLALLATWMAKWLKSINYARMNMQSEAEQSIEHLLRLSSRFVQLT